jgi:hypothetical protein
MNTLSYYKRRCSCKRSGRKIGFQTYVHDVLVQTAFLPGEHGPLVHVEDAGVGGDGPEELEVPQSIMVNAL